MTKYARKLQENIEKKIESIRKSKEESPDSNFASYKLTQEHGNPLSKKSSYKEKYLSMMNCNTHIDTRLLNATDRIMIFDEKKCFNNRSSKDLLILKVLNENSRSKICKNNGYLKQNGSKSQRNRACSNSPEIYEEERVYLNAKTANNSIDKRKNDPNIRLISHKNKSISAIKNFLNKKTSTNKDSVSDAINKHLSKGSKKSNLIVNNKNSFNQNLIDNFNKYKQRELNSRHSSMKKN